MKRDVFLSFGVARLSIHPLFQRVFASRNQEVLGKYNGNNISETFHTVFSLFPEVTGRSSITRKKKPQADYDAFSLSVTFSMERFLLLFSGPKKIFRGIFFFYFGGCGEGGLGGWVGSPSGWVGSPRNPPPTQPPKSTPF